MEVQREEEEQEEEEKEEEEEEEEYRGGAKSDTVTLPTKTSFAYQSLV